MPEQAKKPGGKGKKIGSNKVKCAAYKASGRREDHKLKHILVSNGISQAEAYRQAHGLFMPRHLKAVAARKAALARRPNPFKKQLFEE